jgi:hypothetical protein
MGNVSLTSLKKRGFVAMPNGGSSLLAKTTTSDGYACLNEIDIN